MRLIFLLGLLIALTVACSLTSSDDEEATPTPDSSVAQAVDSAPSVTINSPVDGSEVTVGSEVLVFSVARDEVGVTRVELRQNDIVLNAVDSPDPAGLREMSVLQTYEADEVGEQTLEVVAYRESLAGEPAEVTISVQQQAVEAPIPLPTVVVPVPTNDPTCRARINVTGLGLLTQPGFSSTVLQNLNIGAAYFVTGRTADNNWYEIEASNQQRGWIRSVYASLLGNCAAVPVTGEIAQIPTSTPTATPTQTPIPSATTDPLICRAQVLTNNLAVYSGTATTSSVISNLPLNNEYEIVQRTSDGAWWQISLQGVLGWVAASDVAIRGDCSGVLVATSAPSPNRFPSISTIASQILNVNEGKSIPITISDPDGDTLVVEVTSANPTIVRAALESQSSVSLLARQPGQTNVTVTVTDDAGGVASVAFDVTVNEIPNEPPTIAALSSQSLDVGETVLVEIDASDPEGRNPVLSASSSDTSIAVTAPDGSGNVTVRGVAPGAATITVVADDLSGGRTQQTFSVRVNELPTEVAVVNELPTIAAIGNQRVLVGESLTVDIEADDPEGSNVTIAEVRSGAPTIARAQSDGAGGVLVTGVSAGRVDVLVTVEDAQGGTTSTTFTVVVEVAPNLPPTIESIPRQTLLVGDSVTIEIVAEDPEGSNVTIAEITSTSPEIATAEADGLGGIVVTGVSAGRADITVTVEDLQGLTAMTTFRVAVEAPTAVPNLPPSIEAIQRQMLLVGDSVTIEIFAEDPEGSNVVIAEVSSSSPEVAAVEADGLGGILVTGVSAGRVDVAVTVEDLQGLTATTSFRVVVEAPTLESDLPPTIEPIPSQTVTIGEPITVPLLMSDPEGFNPFVERVVSGSDSIARAAPDGAGNLIINGISEGQVDIQVVISDGQNLVETVFRVVVEAPETIPNQSPVVEPIPDQMVMVGESITVPVNATDPEGFNPFLSEVFSTASEIADAASDGEGNIVVTGVSPGLVEIRLTVDDSQGSRVITTFDVEVIEPTVIPNDPPVIEEIPQQTLEAGTNITVPVNASDPEGTNVVISSVVSGSVDIAIAQSDGAGGLRIAGVTPGQVDVEVTVEDGDGRSATTTFRVVVEESSVPNQPPSIQPIADITLAVEEAAEIPVIASDPEGFSPFIASVDSGADTIASVEVGGTNNLVVTGVSPGQTTITVIVEDGSGGTATAAFVVTVPAPPANQPPIVTPIEDLTLPVGGDTSIPVQATDPEGFNTFLVSVESAAETIVFAESDGVGGIFLIGVSPGQATVTFVVGDNEDGETTSSFVVTVPTPPTQPPNQAPVVQPIPDQVIGVDQTVKVFVVASDPEGANLFFGFVESAAETIATAASDGQGNIDVTGVSPGDVTISLSVSDDEGNETPAFFNVTVEGLPEGQVNDAPSIQPVSNQTVQLDTFLPVPLVVSDPEGDEITLRTSSADEAVAAAQVQDGNAVIYGVAEGQTAITVTAQDSLGNSAALVFSVTVVAAQVEPPPADDAPPELPEIVGQLQQNAEAIFASGAGSPDRFIVAGDATPADLLGDAGDGFSDLSAAPDLQSTLDAYLNQPADDGNILNRGGARSSDASWRVVDLLDPANNAPDCGEAPHPLACAVQIQQPSAAVIVIGRNDITQATPLDAFEADVNRVVDELVARGVIPVLTTIPGDPQIVDPYNQVIIRVADENVIPLWNLNAAVPVEQVNPDLTLTSPGVGQNVVLGGAESFGAVKRNLQLLQVLQSLRENVLLN